MIIKIVLFDFQMKKKMYLFSFSIFQDKRNFVRNPPSGVQFQFDFESCYPVANATLLEDMNLKKMRFELVPKA